MVRSNEDTFFRITNKDIWDKLRALEERNTLEHSSILIHQKETNGKVRLNRWIVTTALSLVIIIIGFLISFKFSN